MIIASYPEALGIEIETGEDGPVLRMPFTQNLLGRPNFLHGGAMAGLIELTAQAALRHALADQAVERLSPLTVTVDYLRGGKPEEARAAARVLRAGRRIANVAVEIWQEDRSRPIAAARVTVRITRSGTGS